MVALKLAFGASLLSGLAMYLFASEPSWPVGRRPGVLAYIYAPYHLADVLSPGRAGRVPGLCLVSADSVVVPARGRPAPWTDAALLWVAVAGLILTHNLSAMLFMPLAAAYVLFCFWEGEARGPARRSTEGGKRRAVVLVLAAALLAAGLSAFYVLPVLAESRFAHLSYDYNSTGYVSHLAPLDGVVSPWPAYRYFPDQGVAAERPLGLVQALLVAAPLPVLAADPPRPPWSHLAFWWARLAGEPGHDPSDLAARLAGPAAALSMIQYPWRFMGLVDLSAAVLIGSLLAAAGEDAANAGLHAGRGCLGRFLVFGAASLALMGNALPNLPRRLAAAVRRRCDGRSGCGRRTIAAEQIGATWTAEYLPLTVQEERWAIPRAPLQPESEPSAAGRQVQLGAQGLLSHEFLTDAANGFPAAASRLLVSWLAGVRGRQAGRRCGPPAASVWSPWTCPRGGTRVRLAFEVPPPGRPAPSRRS